MSVHSSRVFFCLRFFHILFVLLLFFKVYACLIGIFPRKGLVFLGGRTVMSLQNSPTVGKMSLLNSLCRLRLDDNKVFVVVVRRQSHYGALPLTTLRNTRGGIL